MSTISAAPHHDAARTSSLADIATTTVSIARKIGARGFSHPRIVPLSTVDSAVLRHVHRFPGITPSEISAHLRLQASNTSAALRELESRGLVVRAADSADRRGVKVTATAKAAEIIGHVRDEWSALLADLVPAHTNVAEVAQVLMAIDDALNRGGVLRDPEPHS